MILASRRHFKNNNVLFLRGIKARFRLKLQNNREFSSFEISETDRQIINSVEELCKEFPGKYWQEKDKDKEYPTEFVKSLQESGYLSLLIPTEYGGSGLDLTSACLVLETIHKMGCNGGAAHAQMYTMATLLKHGSSKQKEDYLPKIANGELRLQAFGVSEPNSGTDTLSLETTASKVKNGWLINGTKIWTSRAEYSDLLLLLARTDKKSSKEQLSTFIVDMNKAKQNGMTIKKINTMINHNTCEVNFENVLIPEESLIGEVGKGFKYILDSMNAERM